MAFYGDDNLWYLIADANGLSSGEPLNAGQTLDIPHRANTSNNFETFKPYNPAELVGDTTPNLAYAPPAPSAEGCNVLASIIIIVVAVVVTVATQGALAGQVAGWAGTAIGSGAIAGAAGSIASQVVGIGLGQQEGFNWGQVAMAAVGGGIGGGISEAAGVGNIEQSIKGVKTSLTTLNKAGSQYVLNGLGRAVTAAGSGVGVAAVSKVINGHSGFSWANIAASAASASIGGRLPGEGLNTNGFGNDLLMGIAGSAVGYGVNRAFGGDRSWNGRDVVVDAFGNAIGNSIVQGLSKRPESTTQGVSDKTKQQIEQAKSTGQQISPALAEQFVREVAASKNGAVNLTVQRDGTQLIVGGDGFQNATVDLSQLTDYSSLTTARTGLAGHFGDAWTGSTAGRGLNMMFMNAQKGAIDKVLSTPISQSAAYLAGERRGYNNATYQARDRIGFNQRFAQNSRNIATSNQQRYSELMQVRTPLETITLPFFHALDTTVTGYVDLTKEPDSLGRTDQIIRQGYLPKGEELPFTMSQEIYDRGLDNFTLRLDGRPLDVNRLGMVYSSNPDSVKVHGQGSLSDRGRIWDGDYDFFEKRGTLQQTLRQEFISFEPWSELSNWDNNVEIAFKNSMTFGRNQLNYIAYNQHSSIGKPFNIQYTYNDNDLKYGRNNWAPWRPDIDPSYADPYGAYLSSDYNPHR
ncbi:MAG: hypothetical protein HRT37_25735 [Alteromonadaceae bacterium]|nr:hypothetical protein [Alteromonadaceae bacterium]